MTQETFEDQIRAIVSADAPTVARLIAVARAAFGPGVTHRQLWEALRISRSAYFRNLSKLSPTSGTMGLPSGTPESHQRDYGSPQRDPGVPPAGPNPQGQSSMLIKRYYVPPDLDQQPPPGSANCVDSIASPAACLRELRADWGAECATASRRVAFVNRKGDTLETFTELLRDYGWETIREVHRYTLREALYGNIPASYYGKMFTENGWSARFNAYESRSSAGQLSLVAGGSTPEQDEIRKLMGIA